MNPLEIDFCFFYLVSTNLSTYYGGMELQSFLDQSWQQYCEITPDAKRIHPLLSTERGEKIINDHVAYRTFGLPGISRLDLGGIFEQWGYQRKDDMEFVEKKLTATYWLHPDPAFPKIFISELRLDQVSPSLREWITELTRPFLAQKKKVTAETLLNPLWSAPHFKDYDHFYKESEYAAWTAAFGIRVNHFTVLFNALRSFSSLSELNDFLASHGFTFNSAGGIIKGTPSEKLEQSSTLANRISWKFADGEQSIMGCYYEFARRYPMDNGQLFQGFIPKSADKIFESTFETKDKI